MSTATTDTVKPTDFGLRGLDLLRFVMEVVEERPENWEQGSWANAKDGVIKPIDFNEEISCGTTACIAGWSTLLCGMQPLKAQYWGTSLSIDVETEARKLLGLSESEANELFFAMSREEVYRAVHGIFAKRGELLWDDEEEE